MKYDIVDVSNAKTNIKDLLKKIVQFHNVSKTIEIICNGYMLKDKKFESKQKD